MGPIFGFRLASREAGDLIAAQEVVDVVPLGAWTEATAIGLSPSNEAARTTSTGRSSRPVAWFSLVEPSPRMNSWPAASIEDLCRESVIDSVTWSVRTASQS